VEKRNETKGKEKERKKKPTSNWRKTGEPARAQRGGEEEKKKGKNFPIAFPTYCDTVSYSSTRVTFPHRRTHRSGSKETVEALTALTITRDINPQNVTARRPVGDKSRQITLLPLCYFASTPPRPPTLPCLPPLRHPHSHRFKQGFPFIIQFSLDPNSDRVIILTYTNHTVTGAQRLQFL